MKMVFKAVPVAVLLLCLFDPALAGLQAGAEDHDDEGDRIDQDIQDAQDDQDYGDDEDHEDDQDDVNLVQAGEEVASRRLKRLGGWTLRCLLSPAKPGCPASGHRANLLKCRTRSWCKRWLVRRPSPKPKPSRLRWSSKFIVRRSVLNYRRSLLDKIKKIKQQIKQKRFTKAKDRSDKRWFFHKLSKFKRKKRPKMKSTYLFTSRRRSSSLWGRRPRSTSSKKRKSVIDKLLAFRKKVNNIKAKLQAKAKLKSSISSRKAYVRSLFGRRRRSIPKSSIVSKFKLLKRLIAFRRKMKKVRQNKSASSWARRRRSSSGYRYAVPGRTIPVVHTAYATTPYVIQAPVKTKYVYPVVHQFVR
eukprot:TRINITY_DN9122_c0_g1_i1.p1 TRINITY_DN9122_c0_g1~~TRINITY_DN9122_c0_g1_i1.p1  ORF type:complete len:358 (-),score=38.81 TRINITY_DN9122_c0_g1_i1:293-1366(-)